MWHFKTTNESKSFSLSHVKTLRECNIFLDIPKNTAFQVTLFIAVMYKKVKQFK